METVNKPQSVACISLLKTAEIPWILVRLKIFAQERESNEINCVYLKPDDSEILCGPRVGLLSSVPCDVFI